MASDITLEEVRTSFGERAAGPEALVPAAYAEKTMSSLLKLHMELMEEKERRIDLYRRLMEREQAFAELQARAKLLEAELARTAGAEGGRGRGGVGRTQPGARAEEPASRAEAPAPRPSSPVFVRKRSAEPPPSTPRPLDSPPPGEAASGVRLQATATPAGGSPARETPQPRLKPEARSLEPASPNPTRAAARAAAPASRPSGPARRAAPWDAWRAW